MARSIDAAREPAPPYAGEAPHALRHVEDVERFLDGDRSRRVHAVEAAWLARIRAARVVAYRLPEAAFTPHHEVGGYWVSRRPVEPVARVELGDLLERHAAAGIELRVAPAIAPLWRRVVASSLEFSGIRLRNAQGGIG